MKANESYIGFPPLPDVDEMVDALVNDPPERRWRLIRDLFRIDDPAATQELIEKLQPYVHETKDFRIKFRITIALQALHAHSRSEGFLLIKGKGVQKIPDGSSIEVPGNTGGTGPDFAPVVDFHIHPKIPDLRFFIDLYQAGVTHAVILATDTDPSNIDRPEIRDQLEKAYSGSVHSQRVPFDRILSQIRSSLFTPSHVTNQDVADWVADYPEILFGFGSVDLSKSRQYVEETLEEISKLKLKGIKLLPYSQFFNPSENENVQVLFDYCRQTGSIVLSHTGCGAGPFEILELCQNAHPGLWDPVLKKYPDVALVLAHCGAYSTHVPGVWLYEALQLGKKHKNVYADLAAVDWLLDREMVINEVRKTIGFDRILFGTDYPLPLTAGVSLSYLVSGIKANSRMTEKEKRKVLGENAAKLLGIG